MKTLIAILIAVAGCSALNAQPQNKIPPSLLKWAETYTAVGLSEKDVCGITDYVYDEANKRLVITMNDKFSWQQWTSTTPQEIYSQVRNLLPAKLRQSKIEIRTLNRPIEHLVPYAKLDTISRFPNVDYTGVQWTKNISLPYTFKYGLAGRHISLWASHGKYWSNEEHQWKWQRPFLNDVREDLLTPTIAYELVTKMLEGAGAVVWTPRERSTALTEIIVDNDISDTDHYTEFNGKRRWQDAGEGFTPLKTIIDHINPFKLGTARVAESVTNPKHASTIIWRPEIKKSELLPVYISYKTLPTSTSHAIYTIRHSGVNTHFEVNQQMGGGTWVYLGDFEFNNENPNENCVILTNRTSDGGLVSADAVRFGAGWGNVVREDGDISGEPRCNEGARYLMQWSGMPDTIYSHSNGESDYRDDINVRSLATNYLAGGSVYNPNDEGLCVPIEMTLAMHTDAGVNKTGIVGSLAIATTQMMGDTLATGCSRLVSRDLAEEVLTSICNDMPRITGRWNRRQLWDRNYSETRSPVVPSTIIEMLSHENANDVALVCDSVYRFHLARAIYKGVLRFIRRIHNMSEGIIQPLPISNLSVNKDFVSWEPTTDPLEPTAVPSMYMIQVASPGRDFDNGTMLSTTSCKLQMNPTKGTRIRITAINAGGASMPVGIEF